jgi:hypothetical protein
MAVADHFVPGREFLGQETSQDTVRPSTDGDRIYSLDTVTKSLTVLDGVGLQLGEKVRRPHK